MTTKTAVILPAHKLNEYNIARMSVDELRSLLKEINHAIKVSDSQVNREKLYRRKRAVEDKINEITLKEKHESQERVSPGGRDIGEQQINAVLELADKFYKLAFKL